MAPHADRDTRARTSRQPARIVIFGNLTIGEGRGKCLANMIPIWEEAGAEVEFVGYRDAACLSPQEFSRGLRFRHLGTARRWSTLIRLWWYLRRTQPSVVLARNHLDNMLVAQATRLPGIRTRAVVEARNNYVAARHRKDSKRLAKLRQVQRWYPHAAALITASEGVAKDLHGALDLSGLATYAVPNTILTPEVFRLANEPLGHPWLADGGGPVIVTVARLALQKDLPTLLRAVARLRAWRPVRLMLLGEGPQRAAIQREAARLGISDCVEMPGHTRNPYQWMRAADAVALSSAWEGSPNVLIEALAVGASVVSTDCPSGPCEILEGGRYGRLVPVGDDVALAEGIHQAITDPLSYDPTAATARYTAREAGRRYLAILAPEMVAH